MCQRLLILLLVLASCTLTLAAETPSPLIFHASYDGSVNGIDAKGTVAPLETTGKVEYRPGKVGEALLCGGDAAEVKYPVVGHVRPTQGTVSLWAQAVDWPADEQAFHVLFETQGPGWLVLYKFFTGGWLMLTGIDSSHYSSAWAENYAVNNGDWHHFAGTWAKDRAAIYVDGKLVKDSPMPSLPQEFQGWFRIGDNGWMKPHTSHTLIDEVKIYRYALPADQVALLAQGQESDYRPPITLAVEPHPARGQWKIDLDAAGYIGDEAATATFSVSSKGKTWASGKTGALKDGCGRVVLDITGVPVGEQTVTSVIADGAGKEIGRRQIAFSKPGPAPWIAAKIGMRDRVLKPFTAMTISGRKAPKIVAGDSSVECWGRKYRLDAAFPSQIESKGEKLLSQPVALQAATAAGPVQWQGANTKITGFSSTRVTQSATAEGAGLALQTRTTAEYDGMLWTDVTLTPKAPTELTNLTLQIPLDARFARYIHHERPSWGEDDAGNLPAEGYGAPGFQPYVWLGDDDRGLAWFAESQRGWTVVPGKPCIEAKRDGDTVLLQIHMIMGPTKLDKPLQLSFGLQATPVKPRPANARSWRLGNLGTGDNLKDPSMGTVQVLWPNGNLQFYGWPVPKDPAAFRKTVDELHAKGQRVIPYVNLNFMANAAEEWSYYSADFADRARSFTTGDVGQMGSALIGACPSVEAWRDLIAWKLAKFVEEYHVDGIYVDCWNPTSCLIEDHGCGWRAADGTLMGRHPILGMREVVRRVRELLEDRVKDPHIIIHMSVDVNIPMLAFADSMLDGEQYQGTKAPNDDYQTVIPLDKWRAENTGLQWGVAPFFLPEFGGSNRTKLEPTHRLMGLMLAHDCGPWPIWCNSQVVFDAWKAADRYGIQTAEFMPYWKPNGVKTDTDQAVVSVYQQPGRALLAVLNTAQTEQTVKVSVDPKVLGLKAGFAATDAEKAEPLIVEGAAITVKVPARDYVMVGVE